MFSILFHFYDVVTMYIKILLLRFEVIEEIFKCFFCRQIPEPAKVYKYTIHSDICFFNLLSSNWLQQLFIFSFIFLKDLKLIIIFFRGKTRFGRKMFLPIVAKNWIFIGLWFVWILFYWGICFIQRFCHFRFDEELNISWVKCGEIPKIPLIFFFFQWFVDDKNKWRLYFF